MPYTKYVDLVKSLTDEQIVNHLLEFSRLKNYVYDRIKSNPRLTHYASWSSGRGVARSHPSDDLLDDLYFTEVEWIIEEAVVLARANTGIVDAVLTMPNLWALSLKIDSPYLLTWFPASTSIQPEDSEQMLHLLDFQNKYANNATQSIYLDINNWIHAPPISQYVPAKPE